MPCSIQCFEQCVIFIVKTFSDKEAFHENLRREKHKTDVMEAEVEELEKSIHGKLKTRLVARDISVGCHRYRGVCVCVGGGLPVFSLAHQQRSRLICSFQKNVDFEKTEDRTNNMNFNSFMTSGSFYLAVWMCTFSV